MFAAMVFTIKNPEAADKADAQANAEAGAEAKPAREPSRCAGCGIPSGKPSEGGSTLSGKGPGQPLYCMDCKPGSLSREQAGAAIEKMAEMVGVA